MYKIKSNKYSAAEFVYTYAVLATKANNTNDFSNKTIQLPLPIEYFKYIFIPILYNLK
jgi:hypothetical protein